MRIERPTVVVDVEPLTQERLEALWKEAGEALNLKELLSEAKVTLTEHNNFDIEAQNTIFSNNFKPHKLEVIEWLRAKTGLKMLDARVHVRYVEKDDVPYSPEEKYAAMQARNPHIFELRKLFPLIDY